MIQKPIILLVDALNAKILTALIAMLTIKNVMAHAKKIMFLKTVVATSARFQTAQNAQRNLAMYAMNALTAMAIMQQIQAYALIAQPQIAQSAQKILLNAKNAQMALDSIQQVNACRAKPKTARGAELTT